MGRSILGAVLGYVAMVFVVIAGSGLTWMMLGPTGAFRPGETVASNSWSIWSCVFGLAAAIVGGIVACLIGRSQLAAKILIGLVVVFGLLGIALAMMTKPKVFPDGKQVADLGFVEAGQHASPQTWFNFVIPIVGVIGVIIGSRLMEPKHAEMLIADQEDRSTGQA